MKRKQFLYTTLITVALVVSGVALSLGNDIHNLLTYGWSDWPTHKAYEGCNWERRSFSKMTLFEQDCSDPSLRSPLLENSDGTVVQTHTSQYGYSFKLQLFAKDASQNPLSAVDEWYEKLTPEQQKVCEIQNPDKPLEYFPTGELKSTEGPHPTAHKTRYKIDIRPAISQGMFAKYTEAPGGKRYDYVCGHVIGTTFTNYPPYFEFDDRSPGRYLVVGSYGQEGPMIDLNSIRF